MIRVFLVDGAMNALLETNLGEPQCPRGNYMIDDSEIPVQVEVTAGEHAYTIESWVRDNSDARIKSFGEKIELRYNQTITSVEEGAAGTQKIFAGVARQLDRYFHKVDFWKNNTAPDPQVGGVLLSYAGEKLSAKIVTGAERPDLKCYMAAALIQGQSQLEMVRPYKDEFMDMLRNKVLSHDADTPAEKKKAPAPAKEDKQSGKKAEKATGPKLNFFCNVDTLNFLAGLDYPNDHPTVDLSLDFIEAPYWFIFTDEKENWNLRTVRRGEIFSHDESMGIDLGTLSVSKATGEGSGTTTDQGLSQNMGVFFKACRNLSYYAQENKLPAKVGKLDPQESGVMLSSNGKKLTYKVVSGKDRPDLMCSTLFGGTIMMRPYMEDFWERSEADFMSLEEKIEAAEDGDEYIMEQLALAYLNGDDDVDPDPQKAVYWFTKLAELDSATAQFNLGLHCAKGFGTERNFEKAVYWLKKAADNGDNDALPLIEKLSKAVAAEKVLADASALPKDSSDPTMLADAFETALTFEVESAIAQFAAPMNTKKITSAGAVPSRTPLLRSTPETAQAQADLAATYMLLGPALDQAGPEKDYALAFELAQESAAQNNGDGLWALALAYEHGRGVKKDVHQAIKYYRQGAELGHAPSQHSLACYYFRGDVLKKDNKKAFDLCMKSAQQGYGLAMADVGRCYQFGNGVMGNMKTAVEWYEKALEVIDDPELERKTAMFKMLGQNTESWDEDYPGIDEDDFDDDTNEAEAAGDLPDGFMAAMEAFEAAEEYENELADAGILPDAPRPGNGVMHLSAEGFPRIALKAEEGDKRALEILAMMKAANEAK